MKKQLALIVVVFVLLGCNLPLEIINDQLVPGVDEKLFFTPTPFAPKPLLTPTAVSTVFSTPTRTVLPTEKSTSTAIFKVNYQIDIIGSPNFRQQTGKALDFLGVCAPKWLADADMYLDTIQEYHFSGMDVYTNTFLVAAPTAFIEGYSEEAQIFWYAGAIIHDARHGWQHQNGIDTNWDQLSLADRELIEHDARAPQIAALQACVDDISKTAQFEVEHLLQYLIDMQNGVIPCDYCKIDADDRDW